MLAELDKEELQARAARIEGESAGGASDRGIGDRGAGTQQGGGGRHGRAVPEVGSGPGARLNKERSDCQDAGGRRREDLSDGAEQAEQRDRNLAVSRAEITRAKAQVAQATAMLERAEEDLRNSTIISPIDGLVLSRNVEVGNAVSSILVMGSQSTLLFTLGDVGDVFVRGKVDQADIGKVYHQSAGAYRGGELPRPEV